MSAARLFAVVLLATVAVARIFLHLRPTRSPTVGGFRIHHWMTGVAVLAVGFVGVSPVIGGVGAGLFLDEAVYIVRRGNSHADYVASLRATALLVGGAFAAIWVWA